MLRMERAVSLFIVLAVVQSDIVALLLDVETTHDKLPIELLLDSNEVRIYRNISASQSIPPTVMNIVT